MVQGVSFRHYTWKTALRCNVKGTVKNLFDGDVEAYAQGSEENIARFEEFLNTGPSMSRVDKVIKKELDYDETFADFDILF